MNIDKFGHHVHKRLRLSDYLDVFTDALIKSDSGIYDLRQTRLQGLPSPVSEDEAVNKQYVDSVLKQYFTKKDLDLKVKVAVDNYLKLFKEKLNEALTQSYYSKPEIDRMFNNLLPINKNKNE